MTNSVEQHWIKKVRRRKTGLNTDLYGTVKSGSQLAQLVKHRTLDLSGIVGLSPTLGAQASAYLLLVLSLR